MRALLVIGPAVCALAWACNSPHTSASHMRLAEPAKPVPVDGWQFRPYTISIHPLSYFPEPNPASSRPEITTVEIYVECLDQDEQPTRTPGVFYIEVQDPRSEAFSNLQVDLSDANQNVKYWDPVTKCYRFPIPIPAGFHCAPEQNLGVEATVNLGYGAVLRTSARVACPNNRP